MENSNFQNTNKSVDLTDEDYNKKGILLFNKGDFASLEKAVKLFEKANETGSGDSKYNLSVAYNQMGQGYYYGKDDFPVDYKKAEEYFKEAYELGLKVSGVNLATLYNQLGDVYSCDKKREANQAKAERYYTLAMEYGSKTAKEKLMDEYIELFLDYKFGKMGYICDPEKSEKMLYKAKKLDSTYVIKKAKECFDRGINLIEQGIKYDNYKEIKENLNKASALGIVGIDNDLIDFYKYVGLCYKKGKKGFKKNNNKAEYYLNQALCIKDKGSNVPCRQTKGKGIYS